MYEVWDNVTEQEIAELEGIVLHFYRKDTNANSLNRQRRYKKLLDVRKKIKNWGKNEI